MSETIGFTLEHQHLPASASVSLGDFTHQVGDKFR